MSRPSWQNTLQTTLTSLHRPERQPRLAIVGMGHELRGDDAAGVLVARSLQALCQDQQADAGLLVIDGGNAPENTTGALRRFRPDLVLLVDAAHLDAQPGTVRWLGWEEMDGLSASTHTLPPTLLARYLAAELGCQMALLGIQPAQLLLDTPLSPAVRQGVDLVVCQLASVLRCQELLSLPRSPRPDPDAPAPAPPVQTAPP
jgi:hydrogenase 3 maturation protease